MLKVPQALKGRQALKDLTGLMEYKEPLDLRVLPDLAAGLREILVPRDRRELKV
jgi:hypothetical protein